MSILLGIDPGAHLCGCSLFVDGVLVAAGLVKGPAKQEASPKQAKAVAREVIRWAEDVVGNLGANAELAIELPQTYDGRAAEGDANSLIVLTLTVGAVAALFPSDNIREYKPSEWKGSVQKPRRASEEYAITRKVKSRLTPEELVCVAWPGSAKHSWDVADGLGIGLTALGRFERIRQFARD